MSSSETPMERLALREGETLQLGPARPPACLRDDLCSRLERRRRWGGGKRAKNPPKKPTSIATPVINYDPQN